MNRNPYDYDRPVEDPKMFFGRQRVVQEIIGGICSPSGVSFALYGGRRMGKSSVLRQIERRLLERLSTDETPKVLPLYIDLDFSEMHTRKDFFNHVIQALQKVIQKHLAQVNLDAGLVDRLSRRREDSPEPQTDFEEAFKYVYDVCFPAIGGVRVAILIDESERIMSVDSLTELRANLRALLSNRPITRGNLVIVMAGSAQFHSDMEEGSPLKNILTEIPLKVLSEKDTLELIHNPTEGKLPDPLERLVMAQTGGHACMTQYVMYGLCAHGLEGADEDLVLEVADSYPERKSAFGDWVQDLEGPALDIYGVLAKHREPLKKSEVRSQIDTAPLQVNRALDALSFHGVITKDAQRCYAVTSELFRRWFLENIQALPGGTQYFSEAILVVDICDSSRIASQYGDHALNVVASALERLTLEGFRRFPAQWHKHRGDGFMITFSSCDGAVDYARGLLDALRAHNADPATEIPIHVRVGVHFGEVGLSLEGERVSNAMNMAARIEAVQAEHLIEDAQSVKREHLKTKDRLFLSEQVVEQLVPELRERARYLGYFEFKNIYGRHKLYALE